MISNLNNYVIFIQSPKPATSARPQISSTSVSPR